MWKCALCERERERERERGEGGARMEGGREGGASEILFVCVCQIGDGGSVHECTFTVRLFGLFVCCSLLQVFFFFFGDCLFVLSPTI